jgi:hypothetical protein
VPRTVLDPFRSRASRKDRVQIKLTPEQRDQVRKATGRNADTLELMAQELEERIAPLRVGSKY